MGAPYGYYAWGKVLPNIQDADHRWRNTCEMLDRLGLDAAALAHGRLASDLRTAVTNCQSCGADQVCQDWLMRCLLYTSPSPRDGLLPRMPSSACKTTTS